ncbi:MAG: type II secretion system F family protein [archaeon]
MIDLKEMAPEKKVLVFSGASAVVLLLIPFLFYGKPVFLKLIGGFTFGAILIAAIPYLAILYIRKRRVVVLEDQFPNFLRDIGETKKSGMTLPLAIQTATKIDYGGLNDDIKLMANQISWGVPFPDVIERFSKRANSPFISRAVRIILEAERSGGNIADVLESVAEDARMIKEAEIQREVSMSEYLATVYTIFFIFLGIIVALNRILLPLASIPAISGFGVTMAGGTYIFNVSFKILFLHMTLIQGFLSGLLAGEISKSSLVAGLKHSLIFVLAAFFVFMVAVYDFQIQCMFAPTVSMFEAMGCIG